ncbi:hypothetical protein NL676_007841 [Syzygium grande]|nr:hypothetical protein NL676_007841 [Syzygium grande]
MEILPPPLHFFISITLLSTAALGKPAVAITLSQPVRDNETLVSAGAKFELGFFTPGNSSNRYVGIWFYNIPVKTIVWVANRDNPINGSSGLLQIGRGGNLVIIDGTGRAVWSTTTVNVASDNVAVRLLDSGNLVLTDESCNGSGNFLWQSFDHPSNTLLAGMKLGWDLRIGLTGYLTSWRDSDDPSTGDITFALELQGLPQKFLRRNASIIQRSGPWNGIKFSGVPMIPNAIIYPQVVTTAQEVYYTFQLIKESTMMRVVLSHSGTVQCCVWNDNTQWTVIYELPNDSCDEYAKCGPNALCTIGDLQICSCLTGYTPKSPQDWAMLVWSGGCVKKKPLNCPKGEGFKKLKGVKVPDMLSYWVNTNRSLDESGKKSEEQSGSEDNLELPILDLEDIIKATNSFSSLNKIGEGGFGPVYKGLMSDGVQIAVKRLSQNSRQGFDEFKNEVLLIARLQHPKSCQAIGMLY